MYWTPHSVIVGSANASANGLGDAGDLGTIEAAFQTNDAAMLAEVQNWFKAQWRQADLVNDAAIRQATEVWDPFGSHDTVLNVLRSNPSRFQKRVSLVYIDEPADPPAIREFEKIAKSHYTPAQLEGYDDGDGPFYQAGVSQSEFEKYCKPGDYIINCAHKNSSVSRVREPGTIEISDTDCIVLLDDDVKSLGKLRFPKEERALLSQAVQVYLKKFRKTEREFKMAKDEFACYIEDIPDEVLHKLIA